MSIIASTSYQSSAVSRKEEDERESTISQVRETLEHNARENNSLQFFEKLGWGRYSITLNSLEKLALDDLKKEALRPSLLSRTITPAATLLVATRIGLPACFTLNTQIESGKKNELSVKKYDRVSLKEAYRSCSEISRIGSADLMVISTIVHYIMHSTLNCWNSFDLWPQLPRPIACKLDHLDVQVVVCPSVREVFYLNGELGNGLTKIVYCAKEIFSGKEYVAAFVRDHEAELLNELRNCRGICQLHHHEELDYFQTIDGGTVRRIRHFMCMERYDEDLFMAMRDTILDINEIKTIILDLLHGLSALEKENKQKQFIQHNDIKKKNIFLKRTSGAITGAYLGDFGSAGWGKEYDWANDAVLRQKYWKAMGYIPLIRLQRNNLMNVFHGLSTYIQHTLKQKMTLEEMCKDDPLCKKMISEMLEHYDITRTYFESRVD